MSEQACRNVLEMVGVLHMQGYQRLRVSTGMSPSGMHWRCAVAPASNFLPDGQLRCWTGLAAHYSSGQGTQYFDWPDAGEATPSELATLFVERFPEVSAAGCGADGAYAGWYQAMLRLTRPLELPIGYADYDLPSGVLATISGRVTLPLPPSVG